MNHQKCVLRVYTNGKGMFSSELFSIYCCKTIIKAITDKGRRLSALRQSIGGISLRYSDLDKYLKFCPFCGAKIIVRKYKIKSKKDYELASSDEIRYKLQ